MPIPIPGFDFFPGWSVNTACGASSGSYALYYGLAAGLMSPGCTYLMDLMGMSLPSSGTATTPSITLPADQGYHLTMKLVADVKPDAGVDLFQVTVIPAGGSSAVVLTKDDVVVGPDWQDVSIDLGAYAGQAVTIEFKFDDLGGLPPAAGVGILIDDLSLTADCNPN